MAAVLTSAAGIISLLEEPQSDLKTFALTKLDQIVNEFWPEIADSIEKIELLYEDANFADRQLAALVASKVYYHLGSFEDSLNFALSAGDRFEVNQKNEYVETILSKCLDEYISIKVAEAEGRTVNEDPRLEGIVSRMFDQCLMVDKQFKQALGIALETKRMDWFERSIALSENQPDMLAYAFRVAMTLIGQRSFRDKILRSLVGLYSSHQQTPDYVNMCQCLIFLDDAEEAAKLLEKLSRSDQLMAFQIAFDLYESATQNFISKILSILKATYSPTPPPVPAATTTSTDEKPSTETTTTVEEQQPPTTLLVSAASSATGIDETKTPKLDAQTIQHWEKMFKILGGEVTIELQLQFLVRSNKTDMTILKQTKDSVRVSICHTGTVIANSFMHSGTTSDQFLRENLDWLARATNWAKMTATASLGVIHRGHEKEALRLMESYLPRDSGSGGSGYSEGGALYALGLIHANHGGAIIDYLMQQLRDAPNEMIRHGGCMGLGLAAMGLVRQDVYELLKGNLYQDDAVTGESAGIAMGLVMLGSNDQTVIKDMISYAQETQHEKILRGLALGISLTMFGRLENADATIESLLKDKDALLRRAGVLSVAMAYCGTASNSAIQTLLKVAVSDVNDDVRRAAVIGLGFLMFRTPEQCPSVVSLLAESYNPHVRYGAALAIGIACAGSGSKEALALIEPLTQDPVNYVRQGALIASAMLLIQQTEVICPKVKDFRALYAKVLNDKHDDVMAKFGAILAQGIIDAGGRNVTVTLSSRTGHVWLQGAVGMLIFTHYWYWFPTALCLGLAFAPTCLVAVNKHLQMPVLEFKSNAKPSTFAYPPALEVAKKEEKERVATAILSVTAKAKRREAEKAKAAGVESMEVDEDLKEKEKEKEEAEKAEKEAKKEEPEPNFDMLQNPARVMKQQLRYMEMNDPRWRAVKSITTGGINLVRDDKPDDPIDLVQPVAACGPVKEEEEGEEPEAPEAFEYTEED